MFVPARAGWGMGAAGVAGTRILFFDTELIDNGPRGVNAPTPWRPGFWPDPAAR